MWRVMALVATVSAVATQPRFLQTFSRIIADLSMNWMEGLYQRGWTFGAPSPPPRSFEEPPPMEGLQFAAGELYQHLLPGLSCVAVPLLAIGLWTVLGWLGKAVWFTGWILSWIGWLLSGCPCPKRSSLLGGSFGSKDEPPKGNVPKAWAFLRLRAWWSRTHGWASCPRGHAHSSAQGRSSSKGAYATRIWG